MPRRKPLMEIPEFKEIITVVRPTGTGCHVFVPKAWEKRKVKVILLDETGK